MDGTTCLKHSSVLIEKRALELVVRSSFALPFLHSFAPFATAVGCSSIRLYAAITVVAMT